MCNSQESIRQFAVDELLSENIDENDTLFHHSYADEAVSRHVVFSGKK